MFATTGKLLKLHTVQGNRLDTTSTYSPKCFGGGFDVVHASWCHDNTYLALLQEHSLPEIISCRDPTKLELVHTVHGPDAATAHAFRRTTKRAMAIGGEQGEIVLYDTKNRTIFKEIMGLQSAIRILDFNNTDQILTAVANGSVCSFYDLDSNMATPKEIKHPGQCCMAKFHPGIAGTLSTGGEDGRIHVWDVDRDSILSQYHHHSKAVTGIAFSTNQNFMLTTGKDHKVCMIDWLSEECLFRMNLHQPVTAVDISPDDIHIVAGLEDGSVYIYDARDTLKPLIIDKPHTSPVRSVAFCNGPKNVVIPVLMEREPVPKYSESSFIDDDTKEGAVREPTEKDAQNKVKDLEPFDNDIKRELEKMVKTYIGNLENQLMEHCAKFQEFMDKEFESISEILSKWNIFNMGDIGAIINAIINDAETKSIKSALAKKSQM